MIQTADAIDFATELNIPGLQLRRFRDAGDYAKMFPVIVADNHSLGVEAPASVADWQADQESVPHLDLLTGAFLLEHKGQVVAFQFIRSFPEATGTYTYVHRGWVLPAWKGKGIGRAFIRHAEQLLRARAASDPGDAPKIFRAFLQDIQKDSMNLLEQAGYEPERYFYEMVRPTLDDLTAAELPAGLELRAARPDEYPKVWDTLVEGFKDHWGEQDHGDDDYQLWLKRPHLRPDLWQIAWDGERPVALVLNELDEANNAQYNRKRGFTEDITTLKEYRGRGIAQALIVQGLRQFKELGMTEAELAVDSENASGALHLYEKLDIARPKRSSRIESRFEQTVRAKGMNTYDANHNK